MKEKYPYKYLCSSIMGATGAGKSTVSHLDGISRVPNAEKLQFINLVSGSGMAIGQGLSSCTSKVETTDTFMLDGRLVTLIDTPGFDDSNVSDTDILKMIALFLSST